MIQTKGRKFFAPLMILLVLGALVPYKTWAVNLFQFAAKNAGIKPCVLGVFAR